MECINNPSQLTCQHQVPFVVWCYWEGAPMNANRLLSFEYLQKNIHVPVCLITKDNLSAFIKPEFPLHEAFPYLSAVHRSDYIRAYLMHFYGGAWHDIKATEVSFRDCWNEFENPDIYLIGRPENQKGAARVYDEHNRYMPDYWKELVAVPAWIARGNTTMTTEIYAGFLKLLDNNLEALKKHPAKHPREKFIQPKNIFHALVIRLKHLYSGRNPNYPLPWTVFGNIFHPVVYKYREHVSYNLPVNKIKNAGIYHR